MARTYPDGTVSPDGVPAGAGGGMGSVGGMKDGRALRHANNTEPAPQNFGWLSGVKGIVGGPNRAANPSVNIGPSGPLWRKATPKPLTTGTQGKGRKR
jgi:hypothetical protein